MVSIRSQNFADIGNFRDQFKLAFRACKRDGGLVNWVAKVDPELRGRIKTEGRIHIVWSSIRVDDFVVVSPLLEVSEVRSPGGQMLVGEGCLQALRRGGAQRERLLKGHKPGNLRHLQGSET